MTIGTDSAPNTPTPQLLIVGCSADQSHVPPPALLLGQESQQRGIDYLEFLHPGSYVMNDSLDALTDLCIKFNLPPIYVITHSDCGLVEAVASLARDPHDTPFLFTSYAVEVLAQLEPMGISRDLIASLDNAQIAQTLAELIAYRIAENFDEVGAVARADIEDGIATHPLEHRKANLPNVRIAATVGTAHDPTMPMNAPSRTAGDIARERAFTVLS